MSCVLDLLRKLSLLFVGAAARGAAKRSHALLSILRDVLLQPLLPVATLSSCVDRGWCLLARLSRGAALMQRGANFGLHAVGLGGDSALTPVAPTIGSGPMGWGLELTALQVSYLRLDLQSLMAHKLMLGARSTEGAAGPSALQRASAAVTEGCGAGCTGRQATG